MGLFLFGLSLGGVLETTWYVTLVVVGLGMLIFVHELGHFLVAKLCGVKVEKFYLGFDIAGLKLVKFTRGETEYGIGILPLGGYVKMLGQEDNPARLRDELERARVRQAEAPQPSEDMPSEDGVATRPTSKGDGLETRPTDDTDEPPIDLARAERALYDPRSYLAQSVPERMAIISAGVVMNVIFAFVTGVLAYRLGVFQNACGIGAVAPGEAAWQQELKPGDQIVAINGKPTHRFADLQHQVSLGDIEHGVPMTIRRPDVHEPLTVTLAPDRRGLAPTIGVASPYLTTLGEKLPAIPGSAAAQADPKLLGGDKVVQVGEKPTVDYFHLHQQLALHPEERLTFVVERRKPAEGVGPPPPPERVTTEVGPQPMLSLGLQMRMGPIVAVQDNSPAAAAGLQPDDLLVAVDGKPVGDPLTLADRLRRRAEKDARVELTIERSGQRRTIEAALRKADWYETPFREKSPMSAPALGIAFEVTRQVEAVIAGGPGAEAGVRPGDVVTHAKIIPPGKETLEALGYGDRLKQLDLDATAINFEKHKVSWPSFAAYLLQFSLPETRVELTLNDDRTVELVPVAADDWFNPERGLRFQAHGTIVKAESWAEALRLGGRETADALLMVVRFLRKMGSGQVSFRAMGGPVTIAQLAYHSAAKSLADLLIFLTIIGANLAVLNFLPIPLLDGGHMVFLVYEGITGRPPNERVQAILTYLGLLLILGLVIVVFGLDLKLIPRQ